MQNHLPNDTKLQDGKYKIIDKLGQGGFGITYLAIYEPLNKKVAIKEFFPKEYCNRTDTGQVVIAAENTRDTITKLKNRFVKEAKNIAVLDDHPGIVKISEIFEENDTAYYVMDYIEGESLLEMVKRNGPVNPKKAIAMIEELGKILTHIHSRNITHFDIKPSNIMVRKRDGSTIIIDFGLSKKFNIQGEATSTFLQAVSHGYSPMELYSAGTIKRFSPQSDVYSLAATLYYLMTGVVPLSASTVMEDGLTVPARIPRQYHHILEKAMATRRFDRYQTVEEFVEELKKEPIAPLQVEDERADREVPPPVGIPPKRDEGGADEPPAHLPPIPNKSASKRKNKPIWLILAIILAAVIVAAVVLLIVFGNKEEEKALEKDSIENTLVLDEAEDNQAQTQPKIETPAKDAKKGKEKGAQEQAAKDTKSAQKNDGKVNTTQTQPKVTPAKDPAAEAAKKAADKAAQEKAAKEAAANEAAAKKKAAEDAAKKKEETKKKTLE